MVNRDFPRPWWLRPRSHIGPRREVDCRTICGEGRGLVIIVVQVVSEHVDQQLEFGSALLVPLLHVLDRSPTFRVLVLVFRCLVLLLAERIRDC